jgi:hypothetical protein
VDSALFTSPHLDHKKVAIKVPHRQNVDFGDLLRAAPAGFPEPSEHRFDPDNQKSSPTFFSSSWNAAGDTLETVISRDGRIDLARMLTTPARSATPSITPIRTASFIEISGLETSWYRRAGS